MDLFGESDHRGVAQSAVHEFVRFGIFELDLRSSELRRKGVKVKLQQQPFEILRLLVAHPGQFVSRESIQKTLWPDNYFVDFEGSINTAMMKLRRALREDANSPTYIETVARNGYRWIAPIIGDAPAQSTGIRAIAILPLQDLSGIPDSEYFVDGLTDALITEMAQRSELHVVSRMTTVRYKHSQQSMQQIAKELNVQAVVEGSILRSGDRIRVSARLLDAIEDRHLWAQTYDRNLQDILILQQDVVTAIVTSAALALKQDVVSSAPRQINPKAYESFLKGNFLFSFVRLLRSQRPLNVTKRGRPGGCVGSSVCHDRRVQPDIGYVQARLFGGDCCSCNDSDRKSTSPRSGESAGACDYGSGVGDA